MIWYIPTEYMSDHSLKQNTKVLVFDEAPDVVLDTLLVRPSDQSADWVLRPDALDMSRINELSYVGHLTNTLHPAKLSMGLWGFSLAAWHTPSVSYASGINDVTVAHLSMQVNGQKGVAEQLAHKNSGTLLWLHESDGQKDGALRYVWAVASAYNVMRGTNVPEYDGSQPAFIDFKIGDPLFDTDPQTLALTPQNYGFVTAPSSATTAEALSRVANAHPNLSEEVSP